jgi:hypothetical protein
MELQRLDIYYLRATILRCLRYLKLISEEMLRHRHKINRAAMGSFVQKLIDCLCYYIGGTVSSPILLTQSVGCQCGLFSCWRVFEYTLANFLYVLNIYALNQ